MTDVGCELCARVPEHRCPVYGVVEVVTESKAKRTEPQRHTLRLCEWCYTFNWPSRAGRLPVHEEVVAHSEGRKVRWTAAPPPVAKR
jgi:hypothetical protein